MWEIGFSRAQNKACAHNVAGQIKTRVRKWLWPLMPGWPDEGRRIVQNRHLAHLCKKAASISARLPRILNAGSGEGGYSPMLLSLPGVEFLAESDFGWRYQHAPQIDSRQVFFCSSLDSIPVPDRTFEFVLCTEVLEHVPDHERAVDELARVTSPGGWLLITVPTPPALPDAAHVREGYRPAELASMLAHRGYQIVETRFCMHLFFRF